MIFPLSSLYWVRMVKICKSFIRLAITLVVLGVCPHEGHGQPVRALFFGNSLTLCNDQIGMIEAMAAESGKELVVDGRGLEEGTNLTEHSQRPVTVELIGETAWDIIVLQDADYSIVLPQLRERVMPMYACLDSLIRANHAGTRIVFFMDISMKDGVPWGGRTIGFDAFQAMLYTGTLAVADALDWIVAPIGQAWGVVVGERPDIELYHPDKVHPSYEGSYLGACVYYSTFFREDVSPNAFHGTLAATEAEYFQGVASQVVMNDLAVWNNGGTAVFGCGRPQEFRVLENFPNPFNGSTTISYTTAESAVVKLSVYDLAGRVIRRMDMGHVETGRHRVRWDGRDDEGRCVVSGVYIVRIDAGRRNSTLKLSLIE